MMALEKWVVPFRGLKQLDEYFDNLEKPDTYSGFPKWEHWIEENTDKLIIQFLLAGYPRKNLSITASIDKITVSGEKVTKDPKSKFAGRSFKQPIQDLYGNWDFRESKVTFKNGILRLEVPKRKEIQSTRIQIE